MMTTALMAAALSAIAILPVELVTREAEATTSQAVVRFDKSTRRGWLGVSIQNLTPKLAKANGNKVAEGALVNDVERKSPADMAGIEEGDVIVEFDGRKIYDADDLTKAVGRTKPGSTVSITVDRKGTTKTLKATISKYPARMARSFSFGAPGPHVIRIGKTKAIGAELRPLGEQLAEYFQVPDGKGVLVESVKKGSAADKAGLKAGDVIVKLDNERVESIADVWEFLEDVDEGEKVEIEVIRKGVGKKVTVEIEEGEEGDYYEYGTGPRMRWFNDLERDLRLKIHPRIELDELHPDLEGFRHEMDRLKDELRFKHRIEVPIPDIKVKVEKKVRSTI